MNKQKMFKISAIIAIVCIVALFGYFHLDSVKSFGIALLAFAWILVEYLFPFGWVAPKKYIPWKLAFMYALGIYTIIGLAAWLLY